MMDKLLPYIRQTLSNHNKASSIMWRSLILFAHDAEGMLKPAMIMKKKTFPIDWDSNTEA